MADTLLTLTYEQIKQAFLDETASFEDVEVIHSALSYAEKAHDGQFRKGGNPYIIHPVRVALRLVRDKHTDAKLLAMALLHDVIEDCSITKEQLTQSFGAGVAEGVLLLSKTKGEYESYFAALHEAGDFVKLVKVYDRLDNLSTMQPFTPEKRQEYIQETETFFFDLAAFQPNLKQKLEQAVAQW